MKKWLPLVFLVFLAGMGFSQKFHAGILAGGNVSQVDGDNWQGYHKFGFQVGGFTQLRVSKHSSFQFEVEFKQLGSRQNLDSLNQGNTYLLRLNYMEIPFLYQFTFAKRFAAEIGPAADILVSSYEASDGFPIPDPVPLRPVIASGLLGVSAFITHHLKADFRFQYSLMSIRNTSAPYPPSYKRKLFEVGQYNNALVLSLSWDFKENEF
jgi:hypothetical protein